MFSFRRPAIGFIVLSLLWGPAAGAQDTALAKRVPRASLLLGLGSEAGWRGAQLEVFGPEGRWAAFAGVGRAAPRPREAYTRSTAWALGARRFFGGPRHRAVMGAHWGLLLKEPAPFPQDRYGPSLSAGYRFTSGSGLAAHAAAGAGYAPSARHPRRAGTWAPTLNLGIGYTLRAAR